MAELLRHFWGLQRARLVGDERAKLDKIHDKLQEVCFFSYRVGISAMAGSTLELVPAGKSKGAQPGDCTEAHFGLNALLCFASPKSISKT